MSVVPELDSWLSFFRSRRDRIVDLPWSEEVSPSRDECRLIARSIATFQLGESSDGAHLIAAARSFGRATALPAITEVTELFIREEQGHAALLAAFMKANDIPLKRSEWSDRVFRFLRHLAGFELAVSVLVVAELIALTYYRALAAATWEALEANDPWERNFNGSQSGVRTRSTCSRRWRIVSTRRYSARPMR